MATFIIGLVILFGGAALYGTLCEKVFGPDDRATPAYAKQDGVDYVPMRCWKNSLINLLNIAGEEQPDQPAEHRRHRPHPRTHPGHPVRAHRVHHHPHRQHHRRRHA